MFARYICVQTSRHFATKMNGRKVTFKSTNKEGDAQGLIYGDPTKTHKGLIIVPEWWGLDDEFKNMAVEAAEHQNFTVLALDLYRGFVTRDYQTAQNRMDNLDWLGIVADVKGAACHLLESGCTKVGVTGFSVGSAVSFLAALLVPEISAAAPFYGIPNAKYGDLCKIKIPVQGHFSTKDHCVGFAAPEDYLPLNEKLLAAGVPYELFEYEAKHAFTNTSDLYTDRYDKEQTDLAFGRLYRFMDKTLK